MGDGELKKLNKVLIYNVVVYNYAKFPVIHAF